MEIKSSSLNHIKIIFIFAGHLKSIKCEGLDIRTFHKIVYEKFTQRRLNTVLTTKLDVQCLR